MKKTLLIVGGLGLIGFALYRYITAQAKLVQDFDYKISGFNVLKFTETEIIVVLKVLFTNVSAIAGTVNSLSADLYLNDVKTGSVMENNPVVVPANGSNTIDLTISVNPTEILGNILTIIGGTIGDKDVILKIDGSASISSGFIYKSLPVKFSTGIKQYIQNLLPH